MDGDVAALIEQMYPGARIQERDWDDGYLEVEIWHDGREKNVYFNGAGECAPNCPMQCSALSMPNIRGRRSMM